VAFIVVCSVLISSGLTLAAARDSSSKPLQDLKKTPLPTKTVPDVLGQPYVFAESTLQEHGFGWRVEGEVAGWAEAMVESQEPVGGTKVVDTGAPLVKLRLAKPTGKQTGVPDNSSPYAGTKIVYPPASTRTQPAGTSTETVTTTPAVTNPVTKPTTTTETKPVVKPATTTKPSEQSTRPRAFLIAGAKPEPLDEIALPKRARKLDGWLDTHGQVSPSNVRYWLYQHAWIVAGAKLGWWHGAQALEILIAVDERVQELWGVGSKSEAEARAALAFVHAHGG
jgi:hypothetical protein